MKVLERNNSLASIFRRLERSLLLSSRLLGGIARETFSTSLDVRSIFPPAILSRVHLSPPSTGHPLTPNHLDAQYISENVLEGTYRRSSSPRASWTMMVDQDCRKGGRTVYLSHKLFSFSAAR